MRNEEIMGIILIWQLSWRNFALLIPKTLKYLKQTAEAAPKDIRLLGYL